MPEAAPLQTLPASPRVCLSSAAAKPPAGDAPSLLPSTGCCMQVWSAGPVGSAFAVEASLIFALDPDSDELRPPKALCARLLRRAAPVCPFVGAAGARVSIQPPLERELAVGAMAEAAVAGGRCPLVAGPLSASPEGFSSAGRPAVVAPASVAGTSPADSIPGGCWVEVLGLGGAPCADAKPPRVGEVDAGVAP